LARFLSIAEAIIAGETHIEWINTPLVITSIPTPNVAKIAPSFQMFESVLPYYQIIPSNMIQSDNSSVVSPKRHSYFLDNGILAQFSKLYPKKPSHEAYAQVLIKALQLL
jgi:hypothetical protein